jgi:C4-type Zn-finger protein
MNWCPRTKHNFIFTGRRSRTHIGMKFYECTKCGMRSTDPVHTMETKGPVEKFLEEERERSSKK